MTNEQLAIHLYEHMLSFIPPLERKKNPTWLKIGVPLRNEYRRAARELLAEAREPDHNLEKYAVAIHHQLGAIGGAWPVTSKEERTKCRDIARRLLEEQHDGH